MRALRGGGSSDWADRWLGPEGFRYRLQRYAVFSALLLLVLVGYISSLLQQHQGPLPLPDVGPAEGTGGGVSSAVVEDGSDTELLPDLVDGSHLRRPNQILHPLSVLKPDALANEDIPSKTSTSGVGGSASDGGGGGGSASGGGGGGGGIRGAQCNVWEGEWVEDAMYPLYTSRCRHIVSDPTYNCQKNGRNSTEYSHYRWQPAGCSVERFNTPMFLMPLQHRRVVFVGDYAAKQMFMSLLCLLSTPDIETINLHIAPTASPSARPEARRRLRERGRGRRRRKRGTDSGGDNGAGSSSISREKAHVKMTAGHGLDGLLARGRRGRRGRRHSNTAGDNSSSTSVSGAGDVSNTGSTTSRSSSSGVDSKPIQLLRSVMQPNDVTFDFLSSPFLAPTVDLSGSPLSSISKADGDEAEPSARTAVDVTDLDFGVKAMIRQADVVVLSAGAQFEQYAGRPTFVQRQENGTLAEIAWPKALALVLSKLALELKAVRDAPADDAVEKSAADSSRRGKQQLAFFIGVPTSHYGTEGAFLDLSQPLTGSETCPSESKLLGEGETKPRPPRAQAIVREALADTDTIELRITPMTATRGDAHVGKHWPEGVMGKAESDCTHFCLPGVPDTWNELMLHRLLTKGWDADPWNVGQN